MIKGHKIFPYLTILLAAIGIYAGSLGYSFTYDDYHYIVDSEYIKGWRAFFSIFGSGYLSLLPENLDMTRPFMPFSLTVDYTFWGLNPAGYRLTNIILHALNSVLIYTLASYISRGWVPLTASLLFALHPVHTEAVVGITFREDLLVTFFYLSSLICYIRFANGSRGGGYILSLLLFFIALLSKEMAVTLPLVLLAYDYFFGLRGKRKWYRYLPYLGLIPLYLWLLYIVYSNPPTPPAYHGNILDISTVLAGYFKLLVFPFNLSVDYDIASSSNSWTFIFLIISIFASVLYILKSEDKTGSLCIAFFFITLIPVLNIVPTFRLIADRFLYLPSAGFCIFIAVIFYRIIPEKASWRKLYFLGPAAILLFYAATAMDRGRVWQNDLTLWSDVLKKSPQSVRAYTAIGAYYIKEGKDDEAFPFLQKSIELRPDYDKGYYNLGVVYLRKGNTDAAITAMKKAMEITPGYGKAHFNLGLAFMQKEKYDEAVAEYEKALSSMPGNAVLYNNIGNAYSSKMMYDRALQMYEKAVSINPDYADAYYNMGNSLVEKGMYIQALRSYEKAVALDPLNASAYFNMGNLYLSLRKQDKAVSAYKEVLRLNPVHQGARDALELIMRTDKQGAGENGGL